MAKLVLSVNDDAGEFDDNTVNLTNTTYTVGDTSSQYQMVGFRFTGVTVPQGATVRRAVLKLYMSAISTSSITAPRTSAEDADNSAAFSTSASNLTSRSKTAQEAFGKSRIADQTANDYFEFDVTTCVNTVINRAGWSSGNALSLFLSRGTNTSEYTVHTKENAGSDDPELMIIYGDNATAEEGSGAEENVDASWTNISNVRADDGSNATGTNIGAAANPFTLKDFGFSGPTGSDTIDDISVRIQHNFSAETARSSLSVELSWDGGTSWTSPKYTLQGSTVLEDQYVSGGPDGWGHTFTPSELSDANFRVRIDTGRVATSTNDSTIDFIGVTVYYTVAAAGVTTPTLMLMGMGT